ncbi:alternative ribosome rescue aminoacyl-tRNA hydrolase ArfB [Ulvibacter antarcticus]|uniref:Ribosome-associated protein n=1 Tax=Ulvibacter antarcticus TaxID=442714 RepID=A0A3L9Z7Q7_9FLAO|nr:alternative ribosome rescue aminoacyl-tRNA hydrolase ArfB [Ulvibacter antarcticus]RMA66315.1 ribosome-associated protein [Ulvibacter antarcticus]
MNESQLLSEISFKAIRNSGPGGQHVNKTSTRVELSFLLNTSEALSETEKLRIEKKLGNRISQDGYLRLQCGETRSQHRNKTLVIERFLELIRKGIKLVKPRKKTKPSKNSIERRLKSKKNQALKKSNRKPPKFDS